VGNGKFLAGGIDGFLDFLGVGHTLNHDMRAFGTIVRDVSRQPGSKAVNSLIR
jgi:hypothetical protein